MKTVILVVALFAISLQCAQAQRAVRPRSKTTRTQEHESVQGLGYDPLAILGRFLHSVYPDLEGQQGAAQMQMGFDSGMFQVAMVSFEFHPCRWSGVSREPSPIPYCGPEPAQPFLVVILGFTRDRHRPFDFIEAKGSFVSGKLQAIRDGFKDKVYAEYDFRDKSRYWMTADALDALRSNGARYGPDNKKEFVLSLPLSAIEETTGCRLNPESVDFEIRNALGPELEWTVQGTITPTEHQTGTECSATFEPFEGRLTLVGFKL